MPPASPYPARPPLPGPVVVVADGPGAPSLDPVAAARAAGTGDAVLLLGWMIDRRPWMERLGEWPTLSYQPANELAAAARAGRVGYLPVRLASLPALLGGPLAPAVVVVPGVPRGRGFAFTGSVGYTDTAARRAAAVVVEAVEGPDLGAPEIEGHVVAVVEGGAGTTDPPVRGPGETERRIAEAAAALIPEGATVQYGLGRLPEAVVRALAVPVSVASGLVTDAVADLAERDLLVGPALASYVWARRAADLAREGMLRLVGVEELHRADRLAATPRFVAVNAAIEVGLDGAVNVERAGSRLVAGVGGHPDYCAAAARSPGGLSVVVLASTHGGRSSIVASPAVVSTPRCDVHVVVTEHGVADLRGLDEAGRARALLAVADPAHRAELAASLG